ncbi:MULTISPECIES: sulfite exporter TauE/SafE family protein [unclassified Oceanispirochaeta]|uniref:sulfite exporter TauE/SafE family protein n=1 Tax=unclassified Oceanispirochaeta TaxID=2635722 RepID=UPI000E0985AE|nr:MULTISPECIES: sulfite exporter TauE/SafE family protein [unclassified Oceanispirochaeta]MBF9018300.1 sulfite exporter TauE/SafE family protein [Oceanispirochaeta sp. M2]NPD74765.1 sulfite exporter TauE/SafE family protein [Oceanispirochaeta sp. M1]RDG29379.1 sulfite exporter TauE/SafE family protein [Oceanispirochaeta sp. M1]
MEILYLMVALISTTIGAISGLGGGVIIKPVLDTLGQYDILTISLLSSFTVFSMAVVSTIKQYAAGVRFEGKRTIWLSGGSILGGIAGKSLFSLIYQLVENKELITASQSMILGVLLIIVLLYLLKKNLQSFHIHNLFNIFLVGLFLGMIASFLGVGGGPFNVVLLALLFSMDTKTAAMHSVLIILFSQFAKLLSVYVDTGFAPYNLSMLLFMMPGGILGGLIGSSLNRKFNRKFIEILFMITIILIIGLNFYIFLKSML